MSDIEWTAREAFACALCWAEFYNPERRADTPEQYWLSITERARSDIRTVANRRLVVATARGEAVALLPWNGIPPSQQEAVRAAVGLKSLHRVGKMFEAVRGAFLKKDTPNAP